LTTRADDRPDQAGQFCITMVQGQSRDMAIQQVIQDRLLSPHFQPIVAVSEARVVGYEALIRGPASLKLRDPQALFSAAANAGLLRELERACWSVIVEEVARNMDRLPRWARIFLNVLPEDIADAAFLAHVTAEMEKTRIDPARIVIEITETSRIEDYHAFNESLASFRQLGFGVAVDDAGAGHAGLQMIAEINPDFLKIDQSLVRGIDQSIAKRAGVEALLLIARSLGMTVIAEGIENEDELQALHQLGVSLGQGFLLAHPTQDMATGISSIPFQLKTSQWAGIDVPMYGGRGRIGDIAAPAPTVTQQTPMRNLLRIFETRRASDAVVVVDQGVPRGLITRSKVQHEMSRPFAPDRLQTRRAAHLADEQPLIVDCEAQLDAVSRLATARADAERYDDIVVVRDGKLVGTVPCFRLLGALTDARLSSANHSNPLTGLNGHPVIEEWVRESIRVRGTVVLMVHFDINGLRTFNETYGFHQGDRAIRIAADVIATALAQGTGGRGRLGHVGGDDFIAVMEPEPFEDLLRVLPSMFRERVAQLYHPEDRARGHLQRIMDFGETLRTPLMSLRIASISVPSGLYRHYAEALDALTDESESVRCGTRELDKAMLAESVAQETGSRKGSRILGMGYGIGYGV
jgi:EAL domain-containing protein (putative c-di-GMP-specific phosphodiesterase class I)/GGDEF domain-containing protein